MKKICLACLKKKSWRMRGVNGKCGDCIKGMWDRADKVGLCHVCKEVKNSEGKSRFFHIFFCPEKLDDTDWQKKLKEFTGDEQREFGCFFFCPQCYEKWEKTSTSKKSLFEWGRKYDELIDNHSTDPGERDSDDEREEALVETRKAEALKKAEEEAEQARNEKGNNSFDSESIRKMREECDELRKISEMFDKKSEEAKERETKTNPEPTKENPNSRIFFGIIISLVIIIVVYLLTSKQESKNSQ